jgi:DNA-binding LytR/AlgR family response regulator
MIRVLIVDDDSMARASMEYLLAKDPALSVEASVESAYEAREILLHRPIDLVFLDVEMPELSGLELLDTLEIKPSVILTTKDSRYAVEAFEHEVFDFLVKPVRPARLVQSLERWKKRFQQSSRKDDFYVRSEGKFVRIEFEDLDYIETLDDYLSLHMSGGTRHLVHSSLKKMLGELPSERFLRVHRSYVVNIKKIVDFDDTSLVVGRKPIPVARGYRAELRKALGLKD